MRKLMLSTLCIFFCSLIAFAGDPSESTKKLLLDEIRRLDSVEKTLHYRTGKIVLADNVATIDVPKGFKFLDSVEARYVLEDLWGNPKGSGALGLLFPENSGATDQTVMFSLCNMIPWDM